MQSAEIELKVPIADLDRLQGRLPALGFQLDTPRTFEQNTLYDTPERTLRASRQILRVRKYGGVWTVTHKRPAPSEQDSAEIVAAAPRYKVRIETETVVEDGPALGAVFEQLGYAPVFRYEKFRTEWSQVSGSIDGPLFREDARALRVKSHLVVDETPIGDLSLSWKDRRVDRCDARAAGHRPGNVHYGELWAAVPRVERPDGKRGGEPDLRGDPDGDGCVAAVAAVGQRQRLNTDSRG